MKSSVSLKVLWGGEVIVVRVDVILFVRNDSPAAAVSSRRWSARMIALATTPVA